MLTSADYQVGEDRSEAYFEVGISDDTFEVIDHAYSWWCSRVESCQCRWRENDLVIVFHQFVEHVSWRVKRASSRIDLYNEQGQEKMHSVSASTDSNLAVGLMAPIQLTDKLDQAINFAINESPGQNHLVSI